MSVSTLFGLLRHGQTIWNTQGRLQGRLDSPLTSEGIAAVREWAHFLGGPRWKWGRILCSPAPRAVTTAQLINEKLRVEVQEEKDLREQDWGLWEGLSWSEIRTRYGDELQTQIEQGWSFRPPGGESRSEVCDRARKLLSRFGRLHGGEQILVISHQGVMKSLLYAIEKRAFLPGEPKLINKNLLQTVSCCNDTMTGFAYNIEPLPRS